MFSSVPKIRLFLAGSFFLYQASDVTADTLEEALAFAYQTNTELQGAQADLRSVDEKVPQALAGFRPQLQIQGFLQKSQNNTTAHSPPGPYSTDQTSGQAQAILSQPLYSGGSTIASVKGAESMVKAARAKLKAVEQKVLLDAAKAYIGLLTKYAEVNVFQQNCVTVQKFLESAREKFEVGEETRTSVSQAEAKKAEADAKLSSVKAELEGLKADYRRIVGKDPSHLVKPTTLPTFPKELDLLIKTALDLSPDLQMARHQEASARTEIDRIGGKLQPSISLDASTSAVATDSKTKNSPGGLIAERNQNQYDNKVTLQMTWKLYDGGANRAEKREAHEKAASQKISVEQTKLQLIANIRSAWEQYLAAKANIISRQLQLDAQKVGVEGTQQEMDVGAKILLDVLNEQTKYLDVQLELIRARSTLLTTAYTLMSAMGTLTHDRLKLKVTPYNPDNHYNEARSRLY